MVAVIGGLAEDMQREEAGDRAPLLNSTLYD